MATTESLLIADAPAPEPVGLPRATPARTVPDAKLVLDFAGAAILFLLTLPLLLLAAAAVRLSSRGPVFLAQRRVGKNGRVFRMLKLRTMRAGAEQGTGPVWARADDPRVTRTGRVLRRLHLDELPQLLNVLRGEMSLVGPRPERPMFVEIFDASITGYSGRHRVKPGITGLAQVFHKYDETVQDVRRKLAYDLLYIRRMGLRSDLAILALTFGRVLRGETP